MFHQNFEAIDLTHLTYGNVCHTTYLELPVFYLQQKQVSQTCFCQEEFDFIFQFK